MPSFTRMTRVGYKELLLVISLGLVFWSLPIFADPAPSGFSAELDMNPGAGTGGYLFVTLRLETGEKLLFMVDTGSPMTLVDKTLAAKLGDRLATIKLRTLYGTRNSGVYAAPKLFLGDRQLLTGSNVFSCGFTPQSIIAHRRINGILGMDCLRHYCLQLDFEARKMRMAEPGASAWDHPGAAFPIRFVWGGVPVIDHTGLVPGKGTNLLIDTGCHIDGFVEKNAINAGCLGWWYWLFGKRLSTCDWGGQTYSHLLVRRKENLNLLGLRFLARHLVTLDFPNRVAYLEKKSTDPIQRGNRRPASGTNAERPDGR